MKVGIFIVCYNSPELIVPQLAGIRRFCKDDFDVILIDNSTNNEAAKAIKHHGSGCRYIKTNASSKGGSDSHSFAANLGYSKFKDEYDYQFWIDHDCMVFKDFSVLEILCGKLMAGLGQEKDKMYFWPGCFMFNANEVGDVDFSPFPGHDTGGSTYRLIERHGIEKCTFFGEEYFENPYFKCSNPKYNHYSVINEMFMHFIGGSNWEGVDQGDERLNTLLNILNEKINENIALHHSDQQVREVPPEAAGIG